MSGVALIVLLRSGFRYNRLQVAKVPLDALGIDGNKGVVAVHLKLGPCAKYSLVFILYQIVDPRSIMVRRIIKVMATILP